MTLQDKLKQMAVNKNALLATNFYNLETLQGVVKAASKIQQPIILQLTRSSIEYIGLKTSVSLGRSVLKEYGVEGWIHLDHGDSFSMAEACLDAGFDSVMIDGSELPFEDNIAITKKVVRKAELYNAHVEAELGYVAKLGQSQEQFQFTQPEDAKIFVEQTGVHSLAVAIGTAHGFYKEKPNLQFQLLSKIHESVSATLVLHGSSGVSPYQLKEAVSRGICKINLATEIKNIFMRTLQSLLSGTDEIDLRKIFPEATSKVIELVADKLRILTNS